ncbi:hypothetical protein IW01_04410 [Pectobacterium brasiliense]|nr:hypothetical protein IW01_04410 [Pectobacterium brasiliense]GLY60236.1 hypothetical protein Pcaca05_10940 [Pectobacterium carotovorum subsp. carotovorum]
MWLFAILLRTVSQFYRIAALLQQRLRFFNDVIERIRRRHGHYAHLAACGSQFVIRADSQFDSRRYSLAANSASSFC